MTASEIERGMTILIDDVPREIVNVYSQSTPPSVKVFYYDDENTRTRKVYLPDDEVEQVVAP